MEIKEIWKKAPEYWQKYKYVLLVLAAGLVLMLLPAPDTESSDQGIVTAVHEPEVSDEERLAQILSCVEGAGEVRVLLSMTKGEETVYQTDDDITSGESSTSTRIETVLISREDRSETGLIRQVNPPVYLGAVVVCQGGDDPVVRLAIVDAVSNITGLGSDKISVLKMK